MLRNPVDHRLRKQNHGNHCGDLNRLVDGHTQRAILINLAMGWEMGGTNNARKQNKGDTEDS